MGERGSPDSGQAQDSLRRSSSGRARADPGGGGVRDSYEHELVPALPEIHSGTGGNADSHPAGASNQVPASLVLGPDGLADVPAAPVLEDAIEPDVPSRAVRESNRASDEGGAESGGNGARREYYLRNTETHDGRTEEHGGNGHRSGPARINPFGGPGKVEPTIQFVQGAIRARPALTEEIVTAALKLSPEQAHRIVLAAIRANPRAKSSILRIARSAGASGFRLAISLIVALFLYELFGEQNVAEAHENQDAYDRRMSVPESFLAWFTSAAATMAVLFDDSAIGRFKTLLDISTEDDALSFQDIIDRLADLDGTEAGRSDGNLEGEALTLDSTENAAGETAGGGGGFSSYRLESLGDGLNAANALDGETLGRDGESRGGSGRFSHPDLSASMLDGLMVPDPLSDEEADGEGPPDGRDEETDNPEQPPEDAPEDEEESGGGADGKVAAGDTVAEERDSTVEFTITRAGDSDGESRVDFVTVAGSATAGTDFVATSGTLTFAPGATSATVTVDLLEDFLFESTEHFGLRLFNPENAEIENAEAQAVIADSDGDRIVWSLEGDQRVDEGEQARYTLSFGGAAIGPGQTVSIDLTANLPGGPGGAEAADFQASLAEALRAAIDVLGPDSGVTLSGNRITFAEGAPTRLTFALDPVSDGLVEGVENYTLLLADPSVGRIAPDGALVTTAIGNTDADRVRWEIAGEPLVGEGEAAAYSIAYTGSSLAPDATASVRIGIDLPGGPDGAEQQDLTTTVLTAIANAIDALGPDPGVRLDGDVLTFEAHGPARLDFSLELASDTLLERPEGFTLTLAEPSFGEIVQGKGSATTIIDDASTQNLRWSITGDLLTREGAAPRYTVGFSGVTLAEGVAVAIELAVNLPGGVGGAEAADFTRRFYQEVDQAIAALGPDSGLSRDGSTLIFTDDAPTSLTFSLETLDDDTFEDAENFTVLISNPSEGEITAGRNLVTTAIIDDERSSDIVGTDAADSLDGTLLDDRIDGLAGDDIIHGGDGEDVIDAGGGDDVVFGEAGDDTIFGADGNDVLRGGSGDDLIEGGAGLDRLDGGSGNDTLVGGTGADHLKGGSGADTFVVSVIEVTPGSADEVVDFTPGEGDSIHVLDLIGGLQGPLVNVDEFIRLQETDGGDTVVQTDADGTGAEAQFVDTLVLQNTTGLDLEQMVDDGALVVS